VNLRTIFDFFDYGQELSGLVLATRNTTCLTNRKD
jgi:hypothetical protein